MLRTRHDNFLGGFRLWPRVQLSYDPARMRLGQEQVLLLGPPNLDMVSTAEQN